MRWRRLGCEPLEDRRLLSVMEITSDPARLSADAGLEYLNGVMDQYHGERIWVYEDISSPGNHFHCRAKIPDENAAVSIFGSYTPEKHSGATSIRNAFCNTTGQNYGGFYFMNGVLGANDQAPVPNFGTVANAGIDLTGATELVFWAKGARGGETIDFFFAGVGRNPQTGQPTAPYPDSSPRIPSWPHFYTLTTEWKEYRIPLAGAATSYVLGGFGWVANAPLNPEGAVFYLDDIYFQLDAAAAARRAEEPRFLRSYTTLDRQPDPDASDSIDLRMRNAASTYDNSLAVLAYLADGTAESLRRAELVGEAFLYAAGHDRKFDDGRLRPFYMAGDLQLPPGWTPNGRSGCVTIPGHYFEDPNHIPGCGDPYNGVFSEFDQNRSDVGDNAWGMIALEALYRRTGDARYLDAARRMGNFIHNFRNDAGTYQGFQGGIDDPESAHPARRLWASTEHNLDVFVAFTTMYEITGEASWRDDAAHARVFVKAMWDPSRACYLTGTKDDPSELNPSPIPLDAQTWQVLARAGISPAHLNQIFDGMDRYQRTQCDGLDGYDFNEDRDGVWFEGTAQAAAAYAVVGLDGPAEHFRSELRRAQATPPYGDGHGIAAACHDGVSTGFNWKYYRRLHVGATSWLVFAQLGANPYWLDGQWAKPTPVELLQLPGVVPDDGQFRLAIAPIRDGFLTAELTAGSLGPGAGMGVYVEDPSGRFQQMGGGLPRLDVTKALEGRRYLLHLDGLASPVDLRLSNLVRHEGSTVDVFGTAGSDSFSFTASPRWRVVIDGVAYDFNPPAADTLRVEGRGGSDDARLYDSAGDDAFSAHPDRAVLSGPGYSCEVRSFRLVQASAGTGHDTANLYDSAGNDLFDARPAYAVLYGTNFYNRANGFDAVTGRSAGGVDVARLYDGDGAETFTADPFAGTLAGTGFSNRAEGFRYLAGYASTGNDAARLYDSADTDTFVGTPTYATLSSTTFSVRASGFDAVDAYSLGGGNDVARLYDSAKDETFLALPAYARLYANDNSYSNKANGFRFAFAYSTAGGFDAAYFSDSAGFDTFEGKPTYAAMYGTNYYNRANYFDAVEASSTSGGNDLARLYDSAGNDTLVATPEYAILSGPGFSNRASTFRFLNAFSTAGNDAANLYDSAGNDTFAFSVNSLGQFSGTMSGGTYSNRANDFPVIRAHAGTGYDEAKLFDSALNDLLEAGGVLGSDTAKTSNVGLDFAVWVSKFDKVTAVSSNVGDKKHVVPPLDFILVPQGPWEDV